MRSYRGRVAGAAILSLALVAGACGSSGGGTKKGASGSTSSTVPKPTITVGADSGALVARSSPIASGCFSPATTSASPPATRTNSATHSPARRTSSARAGSALMLGIRRSSESSSSQVWSTARVYAPAGPARRCVGGRANPR